MGNQDVADKIQMVCAEIRSGQNVPEQYFLTLNKENWDRAKGIIKKHNVNKNLIMSIIFGSRAIEKNKLKKWRSTIEKQS
jgi:hypothetical protein